MHKNNSLNILTSTIGRVVLLAIIILFIVNIFRSVWKNHQITEQINTLENSISALENGKINLTNRIWYYQTETYKELEARRHLNYKKNDEKVLVLVKKEDISSQNNSTNKQTDNANNTPDDNLPNWQKWLKYIFG